MKFLILIVVFATCRASYAQQPQGSVVDQSYTLTLRVENAEAKIAAPIVLVISTKNISNHPIEFGMATKNPDDAAMFYRTTVLDEKGSPAHDQETKQGRRHRTGKDDPGETTVYVGSMGFFELKPNETHKESFNLRKLYDLKLPGKYTVQVEGGPEDAPIKSNVITITVSRQ